MREESTLPNQFPIGPCLELGPWVLASSSGNHLQLILRGTVDTDVALRRVGQVSKAAPFRPLLAIIETLGPFIVISGIVRIPFIPNIVK